MILVVETGYITEHSELHSYYLQNLGLSLLSWLERILNKVANLKVFFLIGSCTYRINSINNSFFHLSISFLIFFIYKIETNNKCQYHGFIFEICSNKILKGLVYDTYLIWFSIFLSIYPLGNLIDSLCKTYQGFGHFLPSPLLPCCPNHCHFSPG